LQILEGVLLNCVQLVVGEAEDSEAGEAFKVRVVHHRQIVALQVTATNTKQLKRATRG